MSTYEIHGPQLTGDREAAAEAFEATKVGFSYAAFLFAPFWLAARQLWIPLGYYLIGAAIVVSLNAFDLISTGAVFAFALAAAVFVGVEGSQWRGKSLTRRGHGLIDIVEAGNASDAAYLFIARRLAQANDPMGVAPREARQVSQRRDPHVLGLFPEAGRP